jgi:hypothetical protein
MGALLRAARGGSALGAEMLEGFEPGSASVYTALRKDLRTAGSLARGDGRRREGRCRASRPGATSGHNNCMCVCLSGLPSRLPGYAATKRTVAKI